MKVKLAYMVAALGVAVAAPALAEGDAEVAHTATKLYGGGGIR